MTLYADDMTQAFIATLQSLTEAGAIEWRLAETAELLTGGASDATCHFEAMHKGIPITLYQDTRSPSRSPTHLREGDFLHVLAIRDAEGREVWRAEHAAYAVGSLYRQVQRRLIKVDELLSAVVDPAMLAAATAHREKWIQDLIDGDGLRGWLRRQRRLLRARFSRTDLRTPHQSC